MCNAVVATLRLAARTPTPTSRSISPWPKGGGDDDDMATSNQIKFSIFYSVLGQRTVQQTTSAQNKRSGCNTITVYLV